MNKHNSLTMSREGYCYNSPDLRMVRIACEAGFAVSGTIDDASSWDYGTF